MKNKIMMVLGFVVFFFVLLGSYVWLANETETATGPVKIITIQTKDDADVRICDIIAYLGKDRQDALRAKITDPDVSMADPGIGTINAEIINNLEVNIIENSYGKPYLLMDEEH